jgi:Kef-type K+ transport system membrane component KefB
MQENVEFFFALGGILLLALATDYIGRHTLLPRVSLLLILGIVIGDQVLDIIPPAISQRFDIITTMALLMIGFLLGGRLTIDSLRKLGQQVIWISVCAATVTCLLVGSALAVAGVSTDLAILLGCIAAATAPAATVDTVLESGSQSPFSRLLLAIVAIDDVWALLLFSIGLALVSMLNGTAGGIEALTAAGHEILGGLLIGILIGLPAAYITGRLRPGQPMLTEALGLVFICGGLAIWLDVSFLVAAMAMGATIANLARHHDYPFHEIENIEWPFMALFFMLAGASLDIGMLQQLGLIGIIYLLARVAGKLSGAWLGAHVSHAGSETGRWMGAAMLPQAGVAIGMALLVAERFPGQRDTILTIVIGATVVFELLGPIFTRLSLRHTEPGVNT